MIQDEGAFRDRVLRWMKGNAEATDLIVSFHHIAETWDDLIDQDASIAKTSINRAFFAALVEIPRNRFYQDHFSLLNPIVETAILDWHTANAFEEAKENEKAWALASSGLAITAMCARIIGGVDWAVTVNCEFHRLTETMTEFVSERS